jgi:hypothetical protein
MAQNVLVVVDWDLRFTCVLVSWEGSTHDALIFVDALERPNGLSVQLGMHYSHNL